MIPLRRANMRLKLQVAPQAEQDLELLLRQQNATIEKQEASTDQVQPLGLQFARSCKRSHNGTLHLKARAPLRH